jgi:hypothetical protein
MNPINNWEWYCSQLGVMDPCQRLKYSQNCKQPESICTRTEITFPKLKLESDPTHKQHNHLQSDHPQIKLELLVKRAFATIGCYPSAAIPWC